MVNFFYLWQPHHSPLGSTSSGSLWKSIPMYGQSSIILSSMCNQLKKTGVKLINNGLACRDMRSTHLLICRTLTSVGLSTICCSLRNGIHYKAKEIKIESQPKSFNHPSFSLVSFSFMFTSTPSLQLNTVDFKHFIHIAYVTYSPHEEMHCQII